MKLTPITILIFGLCISAVILAVGYCNYWAPKTAEARNYNALQEKLELEGSKLAAQKRNVKSALEITQAAADEWQSIVVRKTPPSSLAEGGINLAVNRWYLVNDAVKFRNRIQQDLNRQLKVGGVKVLGGPTVPPFPDNPLTIVEEGFNYPKLGFPARVYDFGSVTVEGTMEQIRRNVEGWSNMPRYLAVVDGLRIDGTPPRLTGTYNLSMVMYLRSKDIFPPVPEVPGGEAPAGIGGGTGGIGGPGGPAPSGPQSGGGAPRGLDTREGR